MFFLVSVLWARCLESARHLFATHRWLTDSPLGRQLTSFAMTESVSFREWLPNVLERTNWAQFAVTGVPLTFVRERGGWLARQHAIAGADQIVWSFAEAVLPFIHIIEFCPVAAGGERDRQTLEKKFSSVQRVVRVEES